MNATLSRSCAAVGVTLLLCSWVGHVRAAGAAGEPPTVTTPPVVTSPVATSPPVVTMPEVGPPVVTMPEVGPPVVTTTPPPTTTPPTTTAPTTTAPTTTAPTTTTPAAPPITSPAVTTVADAERVVRFVAAQVGEPYVFGAAGPDRWDCSGLVRAAFLTVGIDLPHHARTQSGFGRRVARPRAGDLVFVRGGRPARDRGHVGVAVSATEWIHAPSPGRTVTRAPIPFERVQAVRRLLG